MKMYKVEFWDDGPGAPQSGYITRIVVAPKKKAAIDYVHKKEGVRKGDQELTKATYIKNMGTTPFYVEE